MKKYIVKLSEKDFEDLTGVEPKIKNNYFNATDGKAQGEAEDFEIFCFNNRYSFLKKDCVVLLENCWLGDVYGAGYNAIEDQEIEVSELSSYHYDSNPYGVEKELVGSSAGYDWDDDEEWEAKTEKFREELKDNEDYFIENYLSDYIPEGVEEMTSELTQEINKIFLDVID
jgi:hypothetical protein